MTNLEVFEKQEELIKMIYNLKEQQEKKKQEALEKDSLSICLT